MKMKLILLLLMTSLTAGAQNSNSNTAPTLYSSQAPTKFKVVSGSGETDQRLFWPPDNAVLSKADKDELGSLQLSEQLAELDQATPFSVIHHPTLERYIRVFLGQQRERLERMKGRSSYYFPSIEKYLDLNDLPLELKYLAIVESALNSRAVSPSGAKGMWQFMYGTGKEYGLQIDSYVDERLDYERSTEAACQYLKKLFEMFDSWDLALAAYNSGPGNVRKAIQRSGGSKDYWSIRKYLPSETRGYLPSFYATMYLFEYDQFHELQAKEAETRLLPYDTVHVKKPVALSAVARHLRIDLASLEELNPQFKKNWIPVANGRSYHINLPEEKVIEFIASEDQIYKLSQELSKAPISESYIPINRENSYLVQEGENLDFIAKKHKISVSQLKNWNGLETDYVIAGQLLVVRNGIEDSYDHTPLDQENKNNEPQTYETYKVKPGDTLYGISRMFDRVSIADIREWNGLEQVYHLQAGMVLKIVRAN